MTGPKGEEIYTDKYGRVKVQFHWDREGPRREEFVLDPCLLDVRRWAVRVDLHSADRPGGGGRLPGGGPGPSADHGERVQRGPDAAVRVAGEKTKSTTKTNSSIGGKGFNEIRFEDKKGEEQIFVHGEKNADIRIKSDRREWVGNDRHLVVARDQVEKVERDRHAEVIRDEVVKVGQDRHVTVVRNETVAVQGECVPLS